MDVKDINVDWLNSDNENLQMITIKTVRKILSVNDPNIEGVIKLNVLPRILELMLSTEDCECQMECAWIITNMASGYMSGTLEVVKKKGIDCLKKLIAKTDKIRIKIQCFWALSNIACEDSNLRNLVISECILKDLMELINVVDAESNVKALKICIWTLANLFLSKFPPLSESLCLPALKIFIKYFEHSDKNVRKESIYGICNLIDSRRFLDVLVESEISKEILKVLEDQNEPKIKSNLILIIGNIAYGNDEQTQHIIDIGFLPLFNKMLDTDDMESLKEIIWIISNICAGNIKQVQAIMKEEIFPKIVGNLNQIDFKVRREAVWAVNNATHNGGIEVVKHLLRLEVLKFLTALLDDESEEIVKITCDAIYNILFIGDVYFKKVNLFAILVDRYGALKKLEHLQFHKSWIVIDKVLFILETFYLRKSSLL